MIKLECFYDNSYFVSKTCSFVCFGLISSLYLELLRNCIWDTQKHKTISETYYFLNDVI
jgi:hypothetical protein